MNVVTQKIAEFDVDGAFDDFEVPDLISDDAKTAMENNKNSLNSYDYDGIKQQVQNSRKF